MTNQHRKDTMGNKYINKLLGENELIIKITHQHWTVVFREILPEFGMIIAIILLTTLSWRVWSGNPYFALAYLLMLLPLISMGKDLLSWQNHQYIVTNRRVIQVFGIITKNVSDSSLDKVNDVIMVQSFWGRLLNFGTIEILTASELGINRFTSLDKPVELKTAMLNAKEALKMTSFHDSTNQQLDKYSPQHHLDMLLKTGAITKKQHNEIKSSWHE